MTDRQPRRRWGLGDDQVEVVAGLALVGVLLIVTAVTEDVGTAGALLVFVAGAFGCLALIVSVVRRSVSRGVSDAARWTFGFLGRWYSF